MDNESYFASTSQPTHARPGWLYLGALASLYSASRQKYFIAFYNTQQYEHKPVLDDNMHKHTTAT